VRSVRRRYRSGTLVLETDFETDVGSVRLIDFMPVRNKEPDIAFCCVSAKAGPDAALLRTRMPMRVEAGTVYSDFEVAQHEQVPIILTWLLLRAVAGEPSELQIMYGVAGERRLLETDLRWLPGYEGSRPVRIGNAAVCQRRLDVFGEVMDCFHQARAAGVPPDEEAWDLQRHLLRSIEQAWEHPDEGLWEVRGPPRHFTHSKVMAWVAVDRAVKSAEHYGLEGPLEQWRQLRDRIHRQVCERAFDAGRTSFVQAYDSKELDASLLMIPLVGFLPPEDPRVRGKQYDAERRRLVGNFPQAFSHLALITTAKNLSRREGPASSAPAPEARRPAFVRFKTGGPRHS
jgi:hypothetical protein